MKPTFFETPAAWRKWLKQHHAKHDELLVGFYKKDSGRPSITWPQSVDEALCFGWIDGVRRSIDDVSYTIRFTTRRATSIWSAINIARVAELEKLGLMSDAGREAFGRRKAEKSAIYSHEQRTVAELSVDAVKQFEAKPKAWAFFQTQAPSYKRACAHWIASAKKEETKQKRLR